MQSRFDINEFDHLIAELDAEGMLDLLVERLTAARAALPIARARPPQLAVDEAFGAPSIAIAPSKRKAARR
jgi:hypothetical protein